MAPKRRAVDQLPRTPRKNARTIMPDPVEEDTEMDGGDGPTFELNEGLARVRDVPISHGSQCINEA